jgi:integrase
MRRTPGSGTIRPLKSGKHQVRITGPDGRQVSAGTYATRPEAERALRHRLTDSDRNGWQDPRRSSVTVAEYAEAWLRDRPLRPRTRETYESSLRLHILPTLGRRPLDKLTPAIVRAWHAEVLRVGPTPARQSYALLHAIMRTAVEDDALAKNPCRIKGAGTARSKERSLLAPSQVAELAAEMPAHLRVLVTTAFLAHLRLGEVLGLRWSDIDLEAGTLTVRRAIVETDSGPLESEPKADSRRTIALPAPAVEALAQHREDRPALPSARVFTRLDGQPLRHHHVEYAWSRARARVGLPEAHLHDLRHAGLTLLAQEGATLRELMHRAGHKSSRAAMIYQHLGESRDALLAERMGEAVSQAATGTRKAQASVTGLPVAGTGEA